jgi:hypothetical protein
MRLLRLKMDGFGPLRGEVHFDRGKVTLVVDRNETGKSSLLAAVSAALYGLEDDRRSHKVLTPLERWRPWDGGSHRVELDLECGGETFTVKRDFERGTVEVWNDRGQEITASFREGKDEFPVGKKLLGLDAAEFEKCALVRQGELDQVVPGDERSRRGDTLQARLESAADTRGGDTSAAEALQVLQGALRKYNSPELEFTGTVETAISRLELKRETLAAERNALEHDRLQVAGPLEELARITAEEQAAREAIASLEAERRATVAGDLRRRLGEHEERHAALEVLRAEAGSLASCAHLPGNAEADLSATIAQYETARHGLSGLETRRRDEQARERGELESRLESLKAYSTSTVGDADRLVALAGELRRVGEEDARLREQMAGLRDTLSDRGVELPRIEALSGRFGALAEEPQRLLATQQAIALAFQTEVATLERARTASTESLRQIDGRRAARKLPGWFLAALGVSAVVAGGVVLGIHGELRIGMALLGGGAGLALLGVLVVALAGGAQRGAREQALRQLTEAQGRLNELKRQRAEGEVEVEELARALGCRDAVELLRDWNEYQRLQEDGAPVRRTQEQSEALDARRRAVLDEVRDRLARAGGGPPDPTHLEHVAAGIRLMTAARQRLADLEKSWSWIDDERRVLEASVAGFHERAVRILQLAGLAYDPAVPWSEHVRELGGRARLRARLHVLTDELIPQAEARLAPESETMDLRTHIAALEAEAGDQPVGEPGAAPRPLLDMDREVRQQRELVELAQRRRGDLRQQVDETVRKAALREPELLAEQARTEQALERARRFKRAAELAATTIQQVALETHRRWADFLNRRVGELLAAVGAQIDQVRFGEDLDFSVRLKDGQQLARGKAQLQLSVGARDQLHLAVRLAVSEFLSKPGCPLPLLLDDVFASSDDERARAGLRVLIGTYGREHQVVLMTCHRHRHEHLARLDPDLWAAGVQWLELKPAASRTA